LILSRNVWHPLGRKPAVTRACTGGCDFRRLPCPHPELCSLQPVGPAEDLEQLDQDEPGEEQLTDEDEDAELSDAEFYRQLRQSIEGVQAGVLPSMKDAMRPAIQQRAWSPRRKPRPNCKHFCGSDELK